MGKAVPSRADHHADGEVSLEMSWLRRLFRTKKRKRQLSREIDKELAFHVGELTRGNIAAGMSPTEARRQARIAFGGQEQMAEECRRSRTISWIDDFRHDLRFGWRILLKSPGYTIGAILALSLGVGPNTAFFTLYDAMALKPVPVPLPDRIVTLSKTVREFPFPNQLFSYPEYQYYRDHNTMFDALSANLPQHLRMTTAGSAGASSSSEAVFGLFVSANYFSVMRVDPVAGNGFVPADDFQTAPPYPAVLSENFWERRFGRDPQILGKTILFSGIPATIAGITPRDFMGARPEVPDVWLPLAARETPQKRAIDSTAYYILEGRLKPAANLQQEQSELTQLASSFYADNKEPSQRWTISLTKAQAGLTAGSKLDSTGPRLALFALLQGAIGLVLVIACANVAGLLLSKAISRQREIAVRLSLGARRGRLIRQLLTEALIIAQFSGFLSLLTAWWTLKVCVPLTLSALYNAGLSDGGTILLNVTPDVRILLYALSISTLTAVAFALLPALQTTRLNLTESLNEEVPSLAGNNRSGVQGWTVGLQVAVCLMLLIAAGTLVASSDRLLSSNPGFDTDHVLTVSVLDPSQLGYSEARAGSLSRELQARLSTRPGITSIASASRIPLGPFVSRTMVSPEGEGPQTLQDQLRAPRYPFTFVSAAYFETLGISMVEGRTFTQDEISNRAPVAVISTALAAKFWPKQDSLGKKIRVGSPAQGSFALELPLYLPSIEVVGVARDINSDSMTRPDSGAVYLPSRHEGLDSNLLIRTSTNPQTQVEGLTRDLQSIDGNLSPVFRTMHFIVDHNGAFIVLRTVGIVFSAIGLLGLVLALVGIYSMAGYAVGRQTREIGIRMALGAGRTDVRRLILKRSLRSIGAGIIAGVLIGVTLSLLLSKVFQGIVFMDIESLIGVSSLTAMTAVIATYLPARRATNLDPSSALRSQ